MVSASNISRRLVSRVPAPVRYFNVSAALLALQQVFRQAKFGVLGVITVCVHTQGVATF